MGGRRESAPRRIRVGFARGHGNTCEVPLTSQDSGLTSLLTHEHSAWSSGFLLLGIDEVGRGPLAGPVVAAAVVFPRDHTGIDGVRDSKQIKSATRRDELATMIQAECLAFGLGAASVREIARINIRRASILAMRRAMLRCQARLGAHQVTIIVDGLPVPELGATHQSLVKGDSLCHAIAAASIIAKVARDRLMVRLAARRPGYGWESNAGYASAGHISALHSLGLTPHHRQMFCDTAMGQTELI